VRILATQQFEVNLQGGGNRYAAGSRREDIGIEGCFEKFYRKITALRDDARQNREKWRFL